MKIGLIDVDGHNFPNLALMKISSYHKKMGDNVEFVYYFSSYDIVYMSKIFTFSEEDNTVINSNNIIKGGTGYDIKKCLPEEVEHSFPDYSLYSNYKFAIGFLTRGCPRACKFCIVNEKEGNTHKVADVNEFWNGQKEIQILDSNILAYNKREDLLEQLVKTKARIEFDSGLDIRLMDNDVAQLIKKMKIKRIHFAYDEMKNSELIEKNIKKFIKTTGFGRHKITVYVLVNFNTTIEEDFYRINLLKSIGVTPYVMIYNKHILENGSVYFKMQRWCNSPKILFSCDWNDYKTKK